jgi:hypothetical protein
MSPYLTQQRANSFPLPAHQSKAPPGSRACATVRDIEYLASLCGKLCVDLRAAWENLRDASGFQTSAGAVLCGATTYTEFAAMRPETLNTVSNPFEF